MAALQRSIEPAHGTVDLGQQPLQYKLSSMCLRVLSRQRVGVRDGVEVCRAN